MKDQAFALLLIAACAACQRVPEEPLSRTTSSASNATVSSTSTTTSSATAIPTATTSAIATSSATPPKCPTTASILAMPAPPPVAAACPSDPAKEGPLKNTATLAFPAAAGLKVEAELAMTSSEIQRGLMFRTKMPEDRGMLFALGERKEHVFWMRNTCLPLDMLFIDDDGTIVGIVENVPTLNDEERTVGCPSTYVLELNAGYCKRHGVKPGQKVSIPPSARRP